MVIFCNLTEYVWKPCCQSFYRVFFYSVCNNCPNTIFVLLYKTIFIYISVLGMFTCYSNSVSLINYLHCCLLSPLCLFVLLFRFLSLFKMLYYYVLEEYNMKNMNTFLHVN